MQVLNAKMPQLANQVQIDRPLNGTLPLSTTGVGLKALAFTLCANGTVFSYSPPGKVAVVDSQLL